MNRYSKKASQKVEKALHEMKEGELYSGRSGRKVKNRKQAVAIAMSEANMPIRGQRTATNKAKKKK